MSELETKLSRPTKLLKGVCQHPISNVVFNFRKEKLIPIGIRVEDKIKPLRQEHFEKIYKHNLLESKPLNNNSIKEKNTIIISQFKGEDILKVEKDSYLISNNIKARISILSKWLILSEEQPELLQKVYQYLQLLPYDLDKMICGYSPFIVAVLNCSIEIVKSLVPLLKNKKEQISKAFLTSLCFNKNNLVLINYLLSFSPDVNLCIEGKDSLYYALKNNLSKNFINKILKNYQHPDKKDYRNYPIYQAILSQVSLETFKLLVESSVKINFYIDTWKQPNSLICLILTIYKENSFKYVKILLEKGLIVGRDKQILDQAIKYGYNTEKLDFLVKKGASIFDHDTSLNSDFYVILTTKRKDLVSFYTWLLKQKIEKKNRMKITFTRRRGITYDNYCVYATLLDRFIYFFFEDYYDPHNFQLCQEVIDIFNKKCVDTILRYDIFENNPFYEQIRKIYTKIVIYRIEQKLSLKNKKPDTLEYLEILASYSNNIKILDYIFKTLQKIEIPNNSIKIGDKWISILSSLINQNNITNILDRYVSTFLSADKKDHKRNFSENISQESIDSYFFIKTWNYLEPEEFKKYLPFFIKEGQDYVEQLVNYCLSSYQGNNGGKFLEIYLDQTTFRPFYHQLLNEFVNEIPSIKKYINPFLVSSERKCSNLIVEQNNFKKIKNWLEDISYPIKIKQEKEKDHRVLSVPSFYRSDNNIPIFEKDGKTYYVSPELVERNQAFCSLEYKTAPKLNLNVSHTSINYFLTLHLYTHFSPYRLKQKDFLGVLILMDRYPIKDLKLKQVEGIICSYTKDHLFEETTFLEKLACRYQFKFLLVTLYNHNIRKKNKDLEDKGFYWFFDQIYCYPENKWTLFKNNNTYKLLLCLTCEKNNCNCPNTTSFNVIKDSSKNFSCHGSNNGSKCERRMEENSIFCRKCENKRKYRNISNKMLETVINWKKKNNYTSDSENIELEIESLDQDDIPKFPEKKIHPGNFGSNTIENSGNSIDWGELSDEIESEESESEESDSLPKLDFMDMDI